jgi:LysM repeat protein
MGGKGNVMRRFVHLFALALLVVFMFGLLPIDLSPRSVVEARPLMADPSALIAAVNAYRTSNGLPAYTVSSTLMGTAQGQADYMASTGNITHTGAGGITLTQRLLNAGYPLAGDLSLGGFRAENITGGPGKTEAQAVQEWTGDAAHLNTMLSPNLVEIGAGVATSGDMVYLVIDCARPTTSGLPQAYTPGAEAENNTVNDFIIPVTTNTPLADGSVYHEVQHGQSLWSIAIEYGTKIDIIRQLNGLDPSYEIQPGDKLLVLQLPSATPAPPTMTPTKESPTVTPSPFWTATPLVTATLTETADPSPTGAGGAGNNTWIAILILVLGLAIPAVVIFLARRNRIEIEEER